MKTEADSFSVIRTRLPYLDRRALSEAWFSALHLAQDGRLAVPRRRADDHARSASGARPQAAPTRADAPGAPGASLAPVLRRPVPARVDAAGPGATRSRLGRSRAATSVSRTAATAAIPPPLDARFTLTVGGARVRLLVRRDGPHLRITAICATRSLAVVRSALASADLAMRLRGHVIACEVLTVDDVERSA